MTTRLARRLLALLVALVAACTSATPSLTPSPATTPAPATSEATPRLPDDGPTAATPSPPATAPSPSAATAPSPSAATPTTSPAIVPSPSTLPTALPTAGGPRTTPAPPSAEILDQLQAAIDAERELRGMPGLAAVVVFPDGTRWSGASGAADLDPPRPATAETPFVVGSITKTFVAAAIMRLAEEGMLSLDDRLSEWLPDYPGADDMSLRQLLNHTAGVFNYFEDPRYSGAVYGDPGHEWTPQEILRRFRHAPKFAPGQGYHYSNTGFILLGLVVEEATGNTLGDELRRRFFEPLGLDDTYFQGNGPPPPESAQGHLERQRGVIEVSDGSDYRPTTSAATAAWAAGGVVSSAQDIATWGRALYGGAVVGPASLHEMINIGATPYAGGTYGLGTRTRLVEGARAFGHTGSLRGFQAAMWHLPAENVTFVVLSNLGRVDVNPTVTRLAAIVFP